MSTEDRKSLIESIAGEIVHVVDKGAKQNDRWWFFMLLIIGLGYAGFERWESGHEREGLRAELERTRSSYERMLVETNVQLTALVSQNTDMLRRVDIHITR